MQQFTEDVYEQGWKQQIGVLTQTERGPLLVVDADDETPELQTDAIVRRNYAIGQIARQLVDPDYTVVVPQKVISRERLQAVLAERGVDENRAWVYGSVLPRRLILRSSKVQVHPTLPGDCVPAWFDPAFPVRLAGSALPGYSCFSLEALREAVHLLLKEFAAVRLKDPSGTSGEGQTKIGSEAALDRFLAQRQESWDENDRRYAGNFAAYMRCYGYVVEANLSEAEPWSFTLTRTPGQAFTSFGRTVESPTRLPNGNVFMEYGGTSSLTVFGNSDGFSDKGLPDVMPVEDPLRSGEDQLLVGPDDEIVSVAEKHIGALQSWEADGAVRTRANVDVLKGALVYCDGTRETVVASVEDSGRAGGASPAELLSAVQLSTSTTYNHALHSTRHVFNRQQSAVYKAYFEAMDKGLILWDGHDRDWGDKFVFLCVY